jgi:CheY-like chemotaxis protein
VGEMRDEDGYALIRRVREIDPDVPAGALTAYAGPEDRRRVLDAGFHAHIAKPVEPGDLALLVATLSGRGIEPQKPPDPLEQHAAAG